MSTVAAIGRPSEVAGFTLAGARVLPARTVAGAKAAWATLDHEVAVVVLTAESAAFLAEERAHPGAPLTVVMPT
jgi:vacuolar-type H+-ATPase subunit F/Vma7